MGENKRMKVSDLRPHPKNAEIYGEHEDVADLIEKIKRSGQVHTLVVTSNGTVLAGHRRMKACKELGIEEVEVEIRDFDTPEQEIEYIIDNNATREKTNEQKAREAIVLKETLSLLAKKRKVSKIKQNQLTEVPKSAQREEENIEVPKSAQREEENIEVPKSAQREEEVFSKGKTRDIVAPRVGFKSGQEVDRAIKAVEKIDELQKEGKVDDAELLRGVLNNRSVSAAESLAKNIENLDIPQEERKNIQSGCKSPNIYIQRDKKKEENSNNLETDMGRCNDNAEKLKKILVEVRNRYQDYLINFQQDIEWLLSKDFYCDDEDVSNNVHSDLLNCLEKFKSINDLISKLDIDEFESIIIKK